MVGLIALTQLGDLAVLLPITALILLWLFLNFPYTAVWWMIAVVLCCGSTAVLKVVFYECPPSHQLHSPSGHTGFSILAYGAITLMSATAIAGLRQLIMITIGAGFIFAIVASRLLLNTHSMVEVGVGLIIGSASLGIFAQSYIRRREVTVRAWPLLLASAAIMFVLHGRELHAEQLLHKISSYLQIGCG
jgi:membrane-associated phospholipid phosphatase